MGLDGGRSAELGYRHLQEYGEALYKQQVRSGWKCVVIDTLLALWK